MNEDSAVLGCNCLGLVVVLAFWVAVAAVAIHFIGKWW